MRGRKNHRRVSRVTIKIRSHRHEPDAMVDARISLRYADRLEAKALADRSGIPVKDAYPVIIEFAIRELRKQGIVTLHDLATTTGPA